MCVCMFVRGNVCCLFFVYALQRTSSNRPKAPAPYAGTQTTRRGYPPPVDTSEVVPYATKTTCKCANVHVCMCACVHVCLCACVHVCMCACVHVSTCHVCMCMCACVHVSCVHVCILFTSDLSFLSFLQSWNQS